MIFLVLDQARFGLLDPGGAEESATEQSSGVGGSDHSPILECELPFADVLQAEGVESWGYLEIVIARKLIAIIGPVDEEIADWGVMGNLFAVDFGAVLHFCLKSLSDDGVELNKSQSTGFRNICR